MKVNRWLVLTVLCLRGPSPSTSPPMIVNMPAAGH